MWKLPFPVGTETLHEVFAFDRRVSIERRVPLRKTLTAFQDPRFQDLPGEGCSGLPEIIGFHVEGAKVPLQKVSGHQKLVLVFGLVGSQHNAK